MAFTKAYLIPVSVFVILPATFIVTYVIAVLLGHVRPEFPYISDTGTYSPESCIFAQLINLCAFLIGLGLCIRYLHLKEHFLHVSASSKVHKVNTWALYVGLMSALGLSIVANFQETNMFPVHMFGAALAFGLGTVHVWMQSYLSYHTHPMLISKKLFIFRIVLSTIITLGFFITFIAEGIALSQYHGENIRKWYPEDGGFVFHVISTGAEWIVAFAINFYILSLAPEMKEVHIEEPVIIFRRETIIVTADTVASHHYTSVVEQDLNSAGEILG